jgi:stage II sporulation protein D
VLVAFAVLAATLPARAGAAWEVRGAGYGHGVGMSAYGAYGFGKHGASYTAILDHYFARIQVSKLRQPRWVRVLLATRSGSVVFSRARSACGVELVPARTYRAQRTGAGVSLRSSSGRTLKRCGTKLAAVTAGTVSIEGLGVYRGNLDVVPAGETLNVVNRVEVNDYVRGSVPAEVFPSWPMATLKAFAVAARSIALSTDVGGRGFELYPDTRTQNYGGLRVETKRTDRAVRQTLDRVVTHRGKVIQTTYFSSSGGRTESRFPGGPRVPYFKSVDDPYDHYAPLHRWRHRFSDAQMNARLAPYLRGRLRAIEVLRRGDSPRIEEARLVGTRGSTSIRGDTLAGALGLYDRWASFRRTRND